MALFKPGHTFSLESMPLGMNSYAFVRVCESYDSECRRSLVIYKWVVLYLLLAIIKNETMHV